MLLDKLWVRIRGSLLTLKEELSDEGELRQKAEDFLDGLERKLDSPDSRPEHRQPVTDRLDAVLAKMERAVEDARRASREAPSRQSRDLQSYEELEAAWDELMRMREEKKARASDPPKEEAPSKPPRTLG